MDPMKGRSFALLFSAFIGMLLLFDTAHSQNFGTLAAPSITLENGAQQVIQPISEKIHVVLQGDNLIGISRLFDTTPEALMSANGLKDSKILIGQKLRIPVPQSVVVPEEFLKAKDASAVSYEIHTVCRGDNLIRISRIFDTTPEALISANGLKGSTILIGQKLRIPIPQSDAAEVETPQIENTHTHPYTPSSISSVLLQRDLPKDPDENMQPRRIQLVEAGSKLLGVKYRFSGSSEKYGFDCSGLVKNLFSKFNIELPHSSREQFKQGEKVDRDKLEEGDLVFFSSGGKYPNHVGIYIGNHKFIHAASKAKKVIISDLNQLWYSVRYLGARRITDLWWEDRDLTAANH